MVRLALFGAVAMVGACTTPAADQPPAGNRTGVQPAPDTCGASRYANLLGRPYTEAPAPGSITPYRLIGTNDPVTMDYNEQRLNIIYDRENGGRIVGIRCF